MGHAKSRVVAACRDSQCHGLRAVHLLGKDTGGEQDETWCKRVKLNQALFDKEKRQPSVSFFAGNRKKTVSLELVCFVCVCVFFIFCGGKFEVLCLFADIGALKVQSISANFLGGSNSNIFSEFSPLFLGKWSNLANMFQTTSSFSFAFWESICWCNMEVLEVPWEQFWGHESGWSCVRKSKSCFMFAWISWWCVWKMVCLYENNMMYI